MTDIELQLNAWDKNSGKDVFCVQGEQNSRTIRVTLIDRTGENDPRSSAEKEPRYLDLTGYAARMYVEKKDGTSVYFDGDITDPTNGKVSFTLPAQAVTLPGTVPCTIELTNGTSQLKVLGIKLNVQESDFEDSVESSDDFSALDEALKAVGDIDAAVGRADAAADRANEAADRVEPDITQLQTEMDAQVALTQTLQQWIAELNQSKIDKSALADYIVEEGTSGIWTYRKWNSGVAECWGRFRVVMELTSTGITGINKGMATLKLPTGLFVGAPIVNGGVTQYYHNWCAIGAKDKDNIDVAYFQTNLNGNNAERTFDVQANGRWKS